MRSEECLEKALVEWAALYRRNLKDREISVWKRIFMATDPRILAIALEDVTTKAERMPTPGHVTKAIAVVRDNRPDLIPKTGIYYVVGADSKGVPCVYWSDEAMVPAYRAVDCPEGQAFLALMRKMHLEPASLRGKRRRLRSRPNAA